MPSPSPAVRRALAILRAVAEGRATTVSGLARELDIRKTTCHSIVHELLALDLLYRTGSENELRTGHALVALSFSAIAEPMRAAGAASKLMVQLSTMFDASCVATAMSGETLVVAGRCDPGRPLPPMFNLPIGMSVPAIPPAGGNILAWSGDAEIAAWLDRLGDDVTPELRGRHLAVLEATRRRGFSVVLEEFSTSGTALFAKMAAMLNEDRELGGLLAELNRRLESREADLRSLELPQSRVQSISAPVFNASGEVVLSLALTNFPTAVLVESLTPYIDELVQGARTLTRSLGGSWPEAANPDPTTAA